MSKNTTVESATTEVEVDSLDDLLAMPGVGDTTEKNKFFEKPAETDLSFLDKADEDSDDDDGESKAKGDESSDLDTLLDDIIGEVEEEEEEESFSGRPKETKEVGIKVIKSLIDEGVLMPYDDDDKALEDYTEKDMMALIKDNLEEKENTLREKVSLDFFDSLPQELQYAAKYVMDGGSDMQGLFQALASVKSVENLNPGEEDSAERIVSEYLAETGWSQDDIEDEINSWKDAEVLDKKAEKFKDKLAIIRQKRLDVRMAKQSQAKLAQQKAMNAFVGNIYKALEPDDLNGIKMSRKTKEMLYSGLVNPSYETMKGTNTNLLGHLLEKYQHVEPNYKLIAEATWLLQDPEGYRKEIMNMAGNKVTEETVKRLKSAQDKKTTSSLDTDVREDTTRSTSRRGLQSKKQKNIFK